MGIRGVARRQVGVIGLHILLCKMTLGNSDGDAPHCEAKGLSNLT